MFSKKFDRRVHIFIAVLLFSSILGVSFGATVLWPARREAGFMPEQPLPFNHAIHAGTLKIDCQYCHTQASKGPHATVPTLSVCMNCHSQVKPTDATGAIKPAMQQLLDHWERQEPIEWVKVNDVADFVYFDHSRHVTAGVDCRECHGIVESMTYMKREFGLKMSWCLQCHMQEPPEGSKALERGWTTRAPFNCTTCHR